MSTDVGHDPISTFLAGAHAVLEAVSEPVVAEHWDAPSVLEDQTVAGLAGHLARGSVCAVADYMGTGEPDGPLAFDSAGAYYATVIEGATDADHAAIRQRGAQVAAVGHRALVEQITERITEVDPQLRAAGLDRRVAVIGAAVMRLGDYLQTRIVEQVVHLGDLGRSVGRSFPAPPAAVDTALAVGVDVGRHRFGDETMLRALYRDTGSSVLPVL